MPKSPVQPKRTLTAFTLIMITTGTITSIHGAPSMAEYGFGLIFIYLFVALVFLVPSALISAELATGWPEDGGVYIWVREAFGEQLGFVAVWSQWIENVIWFPSILTVAVLAAAYGFDARLADNGQFIFLAVNVAFWLLTITNLFGMKTSGTVASVCTILGRVLPILAIFTLACFYLAKGNPMPIEFSLESFVPDFTDINKLTFIAGAFLTFAGIEASASNAASARNPQRDYPFAILASACLAVILVTLAALAIAMVIPQHSIKLDAGIMQAINVILNQAGIHGGLAFAGLIIALGIFGEVNNWIPAPTRGLLVAGRDGILPVFWQQENKYAAHHRILLFQGLLFSAISTLYLFHDNVQTVFWLMNIIPTMLYVVMYLLMFAAAVRLRYTRSEVSRQYKVPLGNTGIWGLAIIGSVAGVVAIVFGFIPPAVVPESGRLNYVLVVATVFAAFTVLPFFLFKLQRPQWRAAQNSVVDTIVSKRHNR
ncbi:APC family permease [Endozoicomonas gorgoniicola]|uniref:APC family permease n=1 Tax=Endozoicomonas gorgoniicola TaxID=1234144 RepID=A0ABT3MXI0_9GAMM|nr:APC family permease [Endozoicomonas gorgoniicola]MCW7554071.1 APC family permease [Endozoicomonas gorgoniicola]